MPFIDLNVPLECKTLPDIVAMLIRLGYDGCAINQVSKGRFPPTLPNHAAAKIPLTEDAAALLEVRGTCEV